MRLLRTILVFALLRLGSLGGAALAQGVAATPAPRPDGWWVDRHQAKLSEVHSTVPPKFDLVFVGDSITQNYEKTGPAPNEVFLPIWNQYFAPHHALNLGFSGDRTEHVLWRLQHGEVDGLTPKDIVLLIGTNNTGNNETAAQVTEGSEAVVDELHKRMPRARITVIDILPTGGPPRKEEANAQINRDVRAHYTGAPYLRFLDLRPLFLKDGVVDNSLFYDPFLTPPRPALHPNTVGQRKMAQAVAEALYP